MSSQGLELLSHQIVQRILQRLAQQDTSICALKQDLGLNAIELLDFLDPLETLGCIQAYANGDLLCYRLNPQFIGRIDARLKHQVLDCLIQLSLRAVA